MITPAAPSTALSLAAVTGSDSGASEKAPIPEGFAALLALGSGDGEAGVEAQVSADAGLADILAQAQTGKPDGKMLPLLLPPVLPDPSFGPDNSSAAAFAAGEVSPDLARITPDANGQTPIADLVPPAQPDLTAIPASAIVLPVQPVGTPVSVGEARSASSKQPAHDPIRMEARPAAGRTSVAAPAEPIPSAPVAARLASAGERVKMVSMPSAPYQAPASAIAPTMAQPAVVTPKSSMPILAASVQVAARVAISAKVAERGMSAAPYRPADPVIADEPQPASPAPLSAPVTRQATVPSGPAAQAAEPLPELPISAAAAVTAEQAVDDVTTAALPAPVPLVVTAETPAPSPSPLSAPEADLRPAISAPHDFAGLVERLVEARDAVVPPAVRTALHHSEFGRVALAFNTDQGALSVQMASPDPAFAPAVAAAAQASTGADPSTGQNSGQPRSDGQSQGGSTQQQQQAQSQPQAQAQGGERQPRNTSPASAESERETPPRRGEDTRGRDDNGIYA